ncbi:MAG: nucleotidyltransferase domain-containing protein [Bacteroidota bacterium]
MNQHYISQIIEKLKPIDPYKVILFGSHAWGNPDKDSDIDLIVVTNDEYLPKSYKENINVYLKVSHLLSEFKKNISIDLIVYTQPMYKKFIELGSMFSKEILLKGKILYEANN